VKRQRKKNWHTLRLDFFQTITYALNLWALCTSPSFAYTMKVKFSLVGNCGSENEKERNRDRRWSRHVGTDTERNIEV